MKAFLDLAQAAQLPVWSDFKPADALPALRQVLAQNRAEREALFAANPPPTFANWVLPLEYAAERLHRLWSPIGHLTAVGYSDAWQEAYEEGSVELTAYETELSHDMRLYRVFAAIAAAPEFSNLTRAQQTIVQHALRDCRLAGILLEPADKARFQQLATRLHQCQAQFEQHVLKSTQAWSYVAELSELSGLPEYALAQLRHQAQEAGQAGYLVNLDEGTYHAILTYADERALRARVYRAYITRASELADDTQWDNAGLMREILHLRQQMAQLVEFPNYATYALVDKMAGAPQRVADFLSELEAHAVTAAQEDFQALQAFALRRDDLKELQPWDIAYYSHHLQKESLAFDANEMRPYLACESVLQGLFSLLQRLFGLQFEQQPNQAWHPDVTLWAVKDAQGELLGHCYLDLFARTNKRSGAWALDLWTRASLPNLAQTPLVVISTNFTKAPPGETTLLEMEDVVTLFHEMGHALQVLLTNVPHPSVAGFNQVEWDAIEIPSQWLEQFAYERSVLNEIAHHYQSQAPLPDALYQGLVASQHFQAGLSLVRQLQYAWFDYELHQVNRESKEVLSQTLARYPFLPKADFNRFPNSFSHIFAGGYAMGYYGYSWAQVYACDCYAHLRDQGLYDPERNQAFLDYMLSRGGSESAAELFQAFIGRAVDIKPFLHYLGLVA